MDVIIQGQRVLAKKKILSAAGYSCICAIDDSCATAAADRPLARNKARLL